MRAPFAWLVVGALLAVAGAAIAQAPLQQVEETLPPQYEVEVLIFANRDFDATEERFELGANGFDADATATLREAPVFDDTRLDDVAPPLPGVPEPIDPLAAQRAEALRIRPLAPEQLKLQAEWRRLQAIAAYRPLLHLGWVQPGLPESEGQPFDLGTLGRVNPSGTIRVHLSSRNFLHITLDLTYRADGAASPALATSDGLDELTFAPHYQLAATRTVRSRELHYFDHPAFGVLVRVTPVATQDAQGRRPAA
jgi:hypothetical protein